MAIWQHQWYIIPSEEFESYFNYSTIKISKQDFDGINWWKGRDVKKMIVDTFSDMLKEENHWSLNTFMLGDLSAKCVVLSQYENEYKELYIKIDLRDDNDVFLKVLLEFATREGLTFLNHNFEIVGNNMLLLKQDLEKSKSYSFVDNPNKFLDESSQEE